MKPSPGTTLDSTNSLVTGLAGIWPFSEGSGTSAANPVTGSPGTLTGGATWGTGQWGPAVALDGSTGYVAGLTTARTYPLTISAWAKFTVIPATAEAVFIALNDPASLNEFWIAGNSAGTMRAAAQGGGSSVNTSHAVTLDHSWHHWAAVFTSATAWSLYLDGSLLGNATPSPLTPTGITTMSVGGFKYSGTSLYGLMNGLVDVPAVWTRALSGAEIASFYANPFQVFAARRHRRPRWFTMSGSGIDRRVRL
jgi:hypothetical protein